jgi:hypothetical protein
VNAVKRWGAFSILLATFVLAVLPAAAAANNLFTLDGHPVTDGHLAEDPAGNAYVAWTSEGDGSSPEPVRFCKIAPGGGCNAITLPIPGASSSLDSVSGAIPVLVPGTEIVYVVAPSYLQDEIVFWVSLNGGASFSGGETRPYYVQGKTDPTDAFVVGNEIMVSGYNPGLIFSHAQIIGGGGGELEFADPGVGGVAGASMGLDGTNPVIAYWNISDPPYPLFFYRYKGAGSMDLEGNWEGPIEVAKGYEPNLSSGAAGLFMVSEDYTGGQYPNAINVRRFEGTNFGPAKTLAVDSSTDLFVGGAIAQSPSGNRVVVAWPGTRAGDDAFVMRLFTSTDGGASFPTESHVAHLESSYAIGPNAEVATNDAGNGWVLFEDSAGLRIADLTPIAGLPPSPPPLPPIYKGKTKKFVKKVGNFLIILRLPKSCLQSRQRFFAGVGKRKRKQLQKRLGGKIRFTKVVFIYDGKKLKVKKKKPFRYLIDPGPMAAGSTHVVKAKVTLILEKGAKKKKIKRVIKGTVRAC